MWRFLALVLVVVAFVLFANVPLSAGDSGDVTLAVLAPVTADEDIPMLGACGNGCKGRG